MRDVIKEYVKIFSESFDIPETVYEFGALQVPDQIGYADLRIFFSGKEFIGCDMREGPGVDKILNLHDIDLPDNSVGTVLCLDTLEHVEYPHKALSEIHRILKPGGIVLISSVMECPIHDYPYDYWRFTPESFRSLLKDFDMFFVDSAGKKLFPHAVVGIGIKGTNQKENLDRFISYSMEWNQKWQNNVEPYYFEKEFKEKIELLEKRIIVLEKPGFIGKIKKEIQRITKRYLKK